MYTYRHLQVYLELSFSLSTNYCNINTHKCNVLKRENRNITLIVFFLFISPLVTNQYGQWKLIVYNYTPVVIETKPFCKTFSDWSFYRMESPS